MKIIHGHTRFGSPQNTPSGPKWSTLVLPSLARLAQKIKSTLRSHFLNYFKNPKNSESKSFFLRWWNEMFRFKAASFSRSLLSRSKEQKYPSSLGQRTVPISTSSDIPSDVPAQKSQEGVPQPHPKPDMWPQQKRTRLCQLQSVPLIFFYLFCWLLLRVKK